MTGDNEKFDEWNERKKYLHTEGKNVYFYEREVWWCSLGMNIGYEATGKGDKYIRPVVILRKFNKDTALVVPLTTSAKSGKYYFSVKVGKEGGKANLSQIRLIDVRRLLNKFDVVARGEFEELQRALSSIHFK